MKYQAKDIQQNWQNGREKFPSKMIVKCRSEVDYLVSIDSHFNLRTVNDKCLRNVKQGQKQQIREFGGKYTEKYS